MDRAVYSPARLAGDTNAPYTRNDPEAQTWWIDR